MKRELLENVKVQPYTSGNAIERAGYLSAILGCVIGTAGALTLTVTHSEDGNTFEEVTDTKVFPEKITTGGAFTTEEYAQGDVVNIDLDLVGLKPYVKITASGTAAASTTYAIALGDANVQPV